MNLRLNIVTSIDVFLVKQESVHQAFIVDEAQIQQHLPMYLPLEDLVQRGTFVNLVQHSHWAVHEEHTTLMKERLLALSAQQHTSVLRTLLTSIPTLAPRVITVQMVQSMQCSIHAVKAIIMVLQKV